MTKDNPIIPMINEYLAQTEEPALFSLRAPSTLTIYGIAKPTPDYEPNEDDEPVFRMKKFNGDEKLLLTGVREGKRGSLIMEFDLLSTIPDYVVKRVECVETKMDELFTEHVSPLLSTALGEPTMSFTSAVKKVKRRLIKAVAEEEKAVENNKYADNPNWGSF